MQFHVTASISYDYNTEDGLVSTAELARQDVEDIIASGDLSPGDFDIVVRERPSADDATVRPTADCGCGYTLVWVEGQWQHDAAPSLWGDDHDPDAPEPTGAAREYWDREDGVIADTWTCPGCGSKIEPSDVRRHASECDKYDGSEGV